MAKIDFSLPVSKFGETKINPYSYSMEGKFNNPYAIPYLAGQFHSGSGMQYGGGFMGLSFPFKQSSESRFGVGAGFSGVNIPKYGFSKFDIATKLGLTFKF